MDLSRRSFVAGASLVAGSLVFGRSLEAWAQPAGYTWETHKKAGIKFLFPTTWTKQVDGDFFIMKHAAFGANGLALEFEGVVGGANANQAEKDMLKSVGRALNGARTNGPAKAVAQNGLTGFVVNGTGTNKSGVAKEWSSIVLGDGRGHGMLTLVMANVGVIGSSIETRTILDSIRLA